MSAVAAAVANGSSHTGTVTAQENVTADTMRGETLRSQHGSGRERAPRSRFAAAGRRFGQRNKIGIEGARAQGFGHSLELFRKQ